MKSRARRADSAQGLARLALLPVAAFLVHQLRYLLAFGGHAGAVLQATGHSYLNSLAPWLVLLLSLVAGGFLRSVGRSLAGHRSPSGYTLSLAGLWALCTLSLICIFAVQELLEGAFATGHAAGLVGVFGFGGWWAIPAAAIVGLVLATLLHGALWVLREAARLSSSGRRSPARRIPGARRPALAVFTLPAPLVAGWSGRGPPAR
jgi:hypothetical protein